MGSQSIKLDAYRNDVLNALLKSGGLPGEKAKDQVIILRYKPTGVSAPSMSDSDFPQQPSDGLGTMGSGTVYWDAAQVIPLTMPAGMSADIPLTSSILSEGDIVCLENRETEVFYSAGMLPAGQHLLPRDYDIDIFEAMSIVGYSYGSGGTGGNLMGLTGVAPTQLFVFRKCPDGGQVTIKVDLEKALRDPRERLIVKSGDKLFLRYNPKEEVANFGIFSIFTFGFQQFFGGRQ